MPTEQDTYGSPDEFQPTATRDPEVTVRFVKGFIDSIDALVDSLSTVSHISDRNEARRVAVATAVSVLSKYAGQQLYVSEHGRQKPIEGLWK